MFFQSSLPAGMGVPLEAHYAWTVSESEMLGHDCSVVLTTCCFSTAITITEQPVSVSVPMGYSFTLWCRAQGRTSLQYQWFCQYQVSMGWPWVWHQTTGSLHTVGELKQGRKTGISTFVALTRGFLVPSTVSIEEGIAARCLCFPFSLTAA